MSTTAPDVYAVDSAQLAEEMKHITVAGSTHWGATSTIIGGVRRDQISGLTRPVLIIKSEGHDPMHLIALPGDD